MFFLVVITCLLVLFVMSSFIEVLFGDRTYTLVVFSDDSCRIFKTKLSKYRIKRLRKDNIGISIISILCFNDMRYLHAYIKEHDLKNYYSRYGFYEI